MTDRTMQSVASKGPRAEPGRRNLPYNRTFASWADRRLCSVTPERPPDESERRTPLRGSIKNSKKVTGMLGNILLGNNNGTQGATSDGKQGFTLDVSPSPPNDPAVGFHPSAAIARVERTATASNDSKSQTADDRTATQRSKSGMSSRHEASVPVEVTHLNPSIRCGRSLVQGHCSVYRGEVCALDMLSTALYDVAAAGRDFKIAVRNSIVERRQPQVTSERGRPAGVLPGRFATESLFWSDECIHDGRVLDLWQGNCMLILITPAAVFTTDLIGSTNRKTPTGNATTWYHPSCRVFEPDEPPPYSYDTSPESLAKLQVRTREMFNRCVPVTRSACIHKEL